MFRVNSLGADRFKYVKKEVKKMLIFAPFITSFIVCLLYMSVSSKSMLFAYIICGGFIIFYLIFGVYAPILLMQHQNKTISEIQVEDNLIILKTFPVYWFKEKISYLKTADINVSSATFLWYGSQKKDGLRLKFDGEEFFLVKDYFDGYENILNLIIRP